MIKRKKRKLIGTPAYMVTWGDLMSLLLVFFVVLLASANFEVPKLKVLLSSFNGATGFLQKGSSITPQDLLSMGLQFKNLTGQSFAFKRAELKVMDILKGARQKGSIKMRIDEQGFIVSISNRLLFDSGKAYLKSDPEAVRTLHQIAVALASIDNYVVVDGHTDNVPIFTSEFPSNWELSAARAVSVVKFLIKNGVPPTRLGAAGYAQYRPLVPNTTTENRQRNRRVDIVILKQTEKVIGPR